MGACDSGKGAYFCNPLRQGVVVWGKGGGKAGAKKYFAELLANRERVYTFAARFGRKGFGSKEGQGLKINLLTCLHNGGQCLPLQPLQQGLVQGSGRRRRGAKKEIKKVLQWVKRFLPLHSAKGQQVLRGIKRR